MVRILFLLISMLSFSSSAGGVESIICENYLSINKCMNINNLKSEISKDYTISSFQKNYFKSQLKKISFFLHTKKERLSNKQIRKLEEFFRDDLSDKANKLYLESKDNLIELLTKYSQSDSYVVPSQYRHKIKL